MNTKDLEFCKKFISKYNNSNDKYIVSYVKLLKLYLIKDNSQLKLWQ